MLRRYTRRPGFRIPLPSSEGRSPVSRVPYGRPLFCREPALGSIEARISLNLGRPTLRGETRRWASTSSGLRSRGGHSVAAVKRPDLANAIDRIYEAAAYPELWPEALRISRTRLAALAARSLVSARTINRSAMSARRARRSPSLMRAAPGRSTISGFSWGPRSFERAGVRSRENDFGPARDRSATHTERVFRCVPAAEFHRL